VAQTIICFATTLDLVNVRWLHNDGTKWRLLTNHNTLVLQLHSATSSTCLHTRKRLSKAQKYFWVQIINDIIMTYSRCSWFDTNNKDDNDTIPKLTGHTWSTLHDKRVVSLTPGGSPRWRQSRSCYKHPCPSLSQSSGTFDDTVWRCPDTCHRVETTASQRRHSHWRCYLLESRLRQSPWQSGGSRLAACLKYGHSWMYVGSITIVMIMFIDQCQLTVSVHMA